MKSFQTKLRASILVTISGMLIVIAPQVMRGQTCPGSRLTYIVRDTHGDAINAANQDLRYDPDNGSSSRKWQVRTGNFITSNQMQVPDGIKKLNGPVAPLETEAMCNFKQPAKLHLTLEGKTMNLVFLMPKLGEYDSRDFLVDSLPFRQGTFEIKLEVDTTSETMSRFYPASGWKEVK
jgi:hypothetical protein